MKCKLMFTAATAALLMASTVANAATEIKVASIAPKGTPWIGTLEKWEKAVEKASNGEIDIQIFAGGQLGNEFDVFKQVQRGRIDVGWFSGAAISDNIPETALMSTPFLFNDDKIIDCIYDGELGTELASIVEAKGFKHLQWGETGWVHVYAQDDLSNVEDANGYKARVAPQPMSRLLWDSVGASQTELPYSDTLPALQTGLVKAGESAEVSFVAFGIGKVAPHFMKTAHMHQAGAMVMGQSTWDKLTPEEQKVLWDNLPPLDDSRAAIRGMGQTLLKKYVDGGGPVYELTEEQRAAWKAKVEPNWSTFVSGLGSKAEEMWPQLLKAKAACGG